MNTLNSKEAFIQMNKAAEDWANWAEKVIILENGKKAMFAKCFLKHKLDTKTIIEAEHKARLDPEYNSVVKGLAHAESSLIKAKLKYNNLDRYSSMKQTEIKTDIKLANRQEG
jgi:hypothetical protein